MRFHLRTFHFIAALVALPLLGFSLTSYNHLTTVKAQGDPNNIIDAAFSDMSQRLGHTYKRTDRLDGFYGWEQIIVQDNSLGCPASGKNIPGQTTGYKITISLTKYGTFDYRATLDGSTLFLCSAPSLTPLPPTRAPALPQPTVAPQSATNYQGPVIAYIGLDGNVYVTSLGINPGATRLTSDGGGNRRGYLYNVQQVYTTLRWSPDGMSLLFARLNVSGSSSTIDLFVANSGQAPIKVASSAQLGFFGTWSLDSKEIGYAVAASINPGAAKATYQFQAVPRTGGQPRVVATFAGEFFFEGSPDEDPSHELLLSERGSGNAGSFAWLSTGILHAVNGIADYGLALSALDGKTLWQLPDVYQAVISPDRTHAVALKNTASGGEQKLQMVLIDLANGAITPLQSEPNPEVFTWSTDGKSILYTTATEVAKAQLDEKSSLGKTIFGDFPRIGHSFKVDLWSVPVSGGASTKLFTHEGRGIAVIVPSLTTQLVAFSFVDSSVAAITKINSGKSAAEVTAALPHIRIVTMPLEAGAQAAFFDADSRRPAMSSAAQFNAVPAAVTSVALSPSLVPAATDCPPSLPPRLVVGGKGRVTPGDPNALNTLPAPPSRDQNSKRLTPLQPGNVFTVLAGPTCAYGYTWWQVNYNGTIGWTAEGQGTTYWIEPVQ